MHTTQIIIASAIIIAIVISMFSIVFSKLFGPTVPSPIADVALNLDLKCGVDTLYASTYYTSYISSLQTYLDISVKNHNTFDITIDRIVPISENATLYGVVVPLNIPSYQYNYFYTPVNWANVSAPKVLAMPGDVYTYKSGLLEREVSGKISEFVNNPSSEPPPDNYVPPFEGNVKYDLNINGNNIYAEIMEPGYAIRTLTKNYNGQKVFVLTQYQIKQYYYEKDDIPYYIDIYTYSNQHTGFYMRASGAIGLIKAKNEINISRSDVVYAGFWASSSRAELYLNDNKDPTLVDSNAPNIAGSTVVYGVAREMKAKSGAELMLIFLNYYGCGSYCNPSQWKNYEVDYLYFYVDPFTGNADMKMWGPGAYRGTFDNPKSWTRPPIDDVSCRGVPPYIWIRQVNPPGPNPCDPSGVCHGKELLDLIFGWDDTHGTCIEETFRVTIFEDGWARIEHMTTYPDPKDEIFIAPVDDYAPKADNNRDGFPDNWYHLWRLDGSSVRGVVWKDVSGYIRYEKHPVGSLVWYQGVFRDRYITIKGLYPGDKLIISIPGKVITVNVYSTTMTIDVLSLFTVRELIEALKSVGGILIAIQPSPQRIISLLPSKAYIHVMSRTADTWVEVPVLLRPSSSCVLSYGLQAWGSLVVERKGEVYNLTMIPQGSTSQSLGVFPKAEIKLWYNYRITITYTDGTTKILTPDNLASYWVGILLVTDKAVLQTGSQIVEDNKPFAKIVVEGIIDIRAYLAK